MILTASRSVLFCVSLLAAASASAQPREDLLIADFEGKDYGGWQAAGEAFGTGPAQGTLPRQMQVDGFEGKGLVNSFAGGDDTTGTLTSPPFTIERNYVRFLIGGGMHPGKTCINLLVDGKVVRTATGPNDRPGGSERLDLQGWDVGELAGQEGGAPNRRPADRRLGTHQHRSDRPERSQTASRPDRARNRHRASLPAPAGAQRRDDAADALCRRRQHGPRVRDRTGRYGSGGEPGFWVFSDVQRLQGKTVKIQVDRLPEGSRGLESIVQADKVPDAERLYEEKFRPQFHFSSRRGWNNDPNGLVYHDGEYHLFYQHNPYGWNWGNMHWGHAVSPDLVHWTELPVAIYPYKFGDWAFSGSAVVDKDNTSGLKTGGEDLIVAAYTSTGRGECIALSNDRGRTFSEYAGNPVVKHRGRDPKLIWYKPGGHWVMAVYDEQGDAHDIAFYTSKDLLHWEFQSRIANYFECPEIFELPVDGDSGNTRWVVYAADGEYAVGRFDGKTFTTESGKHPYNYGNCFYASQTYSDIPSKDGRRIQIAWGRVGHPDMPFNQMMNFPVELTLRSTDQGIRMFAEPAREIALLHEKERRWENRTLAEGENLLAGVTGELFHLRGEFEPAGAKTFDLKIHGTALSYDVAAQELSCAGKKAPAKLVDGKIRLELLVDRTSIEIFVDDGRIYMPMGVIPPDDNRTLELTTTGGPTKVGRLSVYPLRSAWGR